MKIATYNVNGVNERLPRLLEWLEETRPDVACLQGTQAGDGHVPHAAIRSAGYKSIWYGQGAHQGVAILARHQVPREIRRGLPTAVDDSQARYLEVDVHEIRVASIDLPNGNPQPGPKFDYKLAWLERLVAHAQHLVNEKVSAVLAGDFNVVPTDDDIYNAWVWQFDAVLQTQTREIYQRLLRQGWVDAFRQLHPFERVYTFWVDTEAFRHNAGFRMDFLLLSPELHRRLNRTGVDASYRARDNASDHAPVWIDLT